MLGQLFAAKTEMSKQPLAKKKKTKKNRQTGLQELNKQPFFSFYYQQTLVARLILHEANYSLKPNRLYFAPGILSPLHSLVTILYFRKKVMG